MRFACILFFAIILPVHFADAAISRSLSLGSQGEDVRELQRILNSDPSTRVASVGPGSPGQETDYFGELTRNSIFKFQTKYASEILSPSGLIQPTGIVGPLTQRKLNSISSPPQLKNQSVSTPYGVVPTTSFSDPSEAFYAQVFSASPKIFRLSRYEAAQGETITINGLGFTTGNTVHFSGVTETIDNVVSPDGVSVTFQVPIWIENGSYNLWVTNSNGSSLDISFGEFFHVVEESKGLPEVLSVSPSIIDTSYQGVITLAGKNFDKKYNAVYSSLGMIENVPSQDGKTIKIFLKDFPHFDQLKVFSEYGGSGKTSTDLFFQVRTPNGTSGEQESLTLKLK